jgi:hypothetical protein
MEDLTPASSPLPSGRRLCVTVTTLARQAAVAALSGRVVGASQWIYRNAAVVAAPSNAASPVHIERWATADNSLAAAYVDGRLEVGAWMWPVTPSGIGRRRPIIQPAVSYASLTLLPDRPRAIVDLLGQTPVTRAPE